MELTHISLDSTSRARHLDDPPSWLSLFRGHAQRVFKGFVGSKRKLVAAARKVERGVAVGDVVGGRNRKGSLACLLSRFFIGRAGGELSFLW